MRSVKDSYGEYFYIEIKYDLDRIIDPEVFKEKEIAD